MTEPEKLDLTSHNLPEDKKQELLRLFPEIRTEGGKIDFDKLKLTLGETVDMGRERYGMTWAGKADCFKTIQTPSMGTLLPAPDESINFDTTENLIIEGDNLEVLKLLQKAYLGKVKMIYIDPPYNTGNDFIYPDNYAESLQTYLEYTKQVDAEGRKFGTNTETDGRFHSRWLNMMYTRLYLARNLLREDGVIFISIDDIEVINLRRICDDVFGEGNFLGMLPTVMNLKGNNDEFGFAGTHEFTVVYCKQRDLVTLFEFDIADEDLDEWDEDEYGFYKRGANLKATGQNAPRERRPNLFYPIYITPDDRLSLHRLSERDVELLPITNNQEMSWRWSKDKFTNSPQDVIIVRNDSNITLYKKQRPSLGELPSKKPKTLFYKPVYSSGNGTQALKVLFGEKLFDAPPKPVELIKDFIMIGTKPQDIILDFFAGSGTTAQAILELNKQQSVNRKFILVQLPEPLNRKDFSTIAEITKERARRVITKLNEEEEGQFQLNEKQDRGFRVFKLAESNFKGWEATLPKDGAALEKQLEMHIEHVRDGRTSEDILYEILLKSGFPLTTSVEKIELAGKSVYSVADGGMFICLEKELTMEVIRAMADKHPQRVVCLDLGFAGNDQLKTNAVQIFKNKEIVFKTV